jgi:hypothetical protein
MRSVEVYREASILLTPWARARGYKRFRGKPLQYYKVIGNRFFVITLAVDKYGYSKLLGGGEFYVFLELASGLGPQWFALYGQPHEQLNALLAPGRLEELRAIQNRVIAKLTPPAADDEELLAFEKAGGGSRESILELYYAPITEPFQPGQGAWFRFGDHDDIRCWAVFICGVLPEAIDQFLRSCSVEPEEGL